MTSCKIIMYHYVRPIKNSQYPEIKGLETLSFNRQISYFKRKFGFTDASFLFNGQNISAKATIPPVILTFDDGLKDHFRYVFPLLKSQNIQGLFFPPAKPILEKIVLGVHKIHFILASINDKSKIVKDIYEQVNHYRKKFDLEKPEELWNKLSIPNRFDTGEVIFIKRILQRELPYVVRESIINHLFEKYVSMDEAAFSEELYLSLDEINEMRESGMYFSSHGYSHQWLSYLSTMDLENELEKSMKFCNIINPNNDQIMCYPYGDYNELVINKVKEFGFKAGLTTHVGDVNLTKDNLFTLSRYDTNDYPQ